MPLILPGNVGSATAGSYQVANSCIFDSATDAHMHITYGTAGNQKKWTWSGWIKRGTNFTTHQNLFAVGTANNNFTFLQFNTSSNIVWYQATSGGTTSYLETDAIYRDPGAWMHVLLSIDTTLSTANNRNRLWVNGTEVTSFTYRTNYDQNHDGGINDDVKHYLGGTTTGISDAEWDGYMAEVVFQDGVAHTGAGDFGEFDSDSPTVWKPINVSGLTFGSNGFYLDFEDSSALGNDISGNNNDLTVSAIAATDQSIDTCTNNFATLNPLSADEMTFSNGNLDVDQASDAGGGSRTDDNARGTIGVNVGKWYWEVKLTGATAPCVVGICFDQLAQGSDLSGSTGVYAIQNASATYAYRRENGTTSETAGFPNPVANNIMNVAFDADNAKLYLGINGTYYNKAGSTGNPATASNPTYSSIDTSFFWLPWIESRGDNQQALMNFGSPSFSISSGNTDGDGFGNFEYAPPSGYFALCTKNLAEYG